jgi:energy-coupling factor transport system permease protein
MALALVAAWTTNPLLLGLTIAVAALVVAARREDAPWARAFGLYLRIGLVIVVLRVLLRIVFAGDTGTTVLFTLPELPLPGWFAGVGIGGPVTAEALVAAFVDGLRLATILICFGAANCLANPKRLLRLLPNALYEIGAAVTVALSVAPQLAESVVRVRRAQRLRGGESGLRRVLLPVLADALDRSISLAAAMDARGYGRSGTESPGRRRTTAALLVGGLIGACIGLYGLLDTTAPFPFGLPALLAGGTMMVGGVALAGRRTTHTRYRPDRWMTAEWAVVGSAAASLALVIAGVAADPASLQVALAPIEWPQLPPLPAVGLLVAALPAVLTPLPPLRAAAEASPRQARLRRAAEVRS